MPLVPKQDSTPQSGKPASRSPSMPTLRERPCHLRRVAPRIDNPSWHIGNLLTDDLIPHSSSSSTAPAHSRSTSPRANTFPLTNHSSPHELLTPHATWPSNGHIASTLLLGLVAPGFLPHSPTHLRPRPCYDFGYGNAFQHL